MVYDVYIQNLQASDTAYPSFNSIPAGGGGGGGG